MIGEEVLRAVMGALATPEPNEAVVEAILVGKETPGGPAMQVIIRPFADDPGAKMSILPRLTMRAEELWPTGVYEYLPDTGYDVLLPDAESEEYPDTIAELLALLAGWLS